MNDIKILNRKAHEALCKNDFHGALNHYQEVLKKDPGDDKALHFVGFLQSLQGEQKNALDSVTKAIKRYACDASYYTTLAGIYRQMLDYPQAVEAIRKACELLPDAVNYSNAAMILADERRFERAKELYRKALELDENCSFIHFNYSLLLLLLGEYEEGLKEYDWRIPFHYNVGMPEYPEDLKGKKIQILPEQGFGDFLMCARYFKPLQDAGAEVYVYCHKAMERLCRPRYCSKPDYTFLVMSLPRLFKGWVPTDNYIGASGKSKVTGFDFKIGVAHKAVKTPSNLMGVVGERMIPHPATLAYLSASKRSLPHDFFDPMLKKGVKFYNLQNDTSHYAMENVKSEDFMDLADWVANMDLIITIDTALVHLAGAMGKTTWLLLPYDCDWRWGVDQEVSKWYPSVRIFRQQKRGDWASVQEQILKIFEDQV